MIGNVAGAVISIGDTFYDAAKLISNPSWTNAGDLGTSILGIIPGIGSAKDVKSIAKATKLTYKNAKTTKSVKTAIKKTVTRKASPKSNVRVNILASNKKTIRSYPLLLTTNPYFKLTGTMGNWGDTMEDTFTGINYLKK